MRAKTEQTSCFLSKITLSACASTNSDLNLLIKFRGDNVHATFRRRVAFTDCSGVHIGFAPFVVVFYGKCYFAVAHS